MSILCVNICCSDELVKTSGSQGQLDASNSLCGANIKMVWMWVTLFYGSLYFIFRPWNVLDMFIPALFYLSDLEIYINNEAWPVSTISG